MLITDIIMAAPYNRLEQRAEIWRVDGPEYWTESQAMTEIRNALSSRSTKSPSIFAALTVVVTRIVRLKEQ
jgi:hypothetical protein